MSCRRNCVEASRRSAAQSSSRLFLSEAITSGYCLCSAGASISAFANSLEKIRTAALRILMLGLPERHNSDCTSTFLTISDELARTAASIFWVSSMNSSSTSMSKRSSGSLSGSVQRASTSSTTSRYFGSCVKPSYAFPAPPHDHLELKAFLAVPCPVCVFLRQEVPLHQLLDFCCVHIRRVYVAACFRYRLGQLVERVLV